MLVIVEGHLYHIKDSFFQLVDDSTLMKNKECGHSRPHYFLVRDKNDSTLLWVIPVSSKVDKYREIIKGKIKKYGRCDTIIIGKLDGNRESAVLIQNMFPVTEQYIDYEHTIGGAFVNINSQLKKEIVNKANTVLNIHKFNKRILFADIDKIIEILKK